MGLKMNMSRWVLAIVLIGPSVTAGAEIYRCESDGVIEFSDTPCQAEPQPYRSAGNVSVVSAPDDLQQTARLNQAFIEQRQEALEEQRSERDRRAEDADARNQRQPAPASRAYLPLRYHGFPRHRRYPVYPSPGRNPPYRSDASREQQPFSALSGPFPGTRRPDRDP